MSRREPVDYCAVLVDDERLARKRLRSLLEAHPEIRVVGEARDLATARHLIDKHAPDVVFLDVQLPPESGFDLLPHVPVATEVIFVTAHDGFAVRAFETNALDYLLKPVWPARLAASIQRLKERRTAADAATPAPPPLPTAIIRLNPEDPLVLRDGRRWHRMEAAAVAAIRGEGSYTRLYTATGQSMLLLRTLDHWTTILPDALFARVSRSMLVNLRRVVRLDAINRDRSNLHVEGQERPLQLGRVASQRLRQLLRETGMQTA